MSFVAANDALNTAIAALGYPVAWPNVVFNPTVNHLRVNVLGSRSELHTFGLDRIPATLQIDCVVKEGDGANVAAAMADVIQAAFSRGDTFTEAGTTVRVDREPYTSTGIISNGWYSLPVSIPIERYK